MDETVTILADINRSASWVSTIACALIATSDVASGRVDPELLRMLVDAVHGYRRHRRALFRAATAVSSGQEDAVDSHVPDHFERLRDAQADADDDVVNRLRRGRR